MDLGSKTVPKSVLKTYIGPIFVSISTQKQRELATVQAQDRAQGLGLTFEAAVHQECKLK